MFVGCNQKQNRWVRHSAVHQVEAPLCCSEVKWTHYHTVHIFSLHTSCSQVNKQSNIRPHSQPRDVKRKILRGTHYVASQQQTIHTTKVWGISATLPTVWHNAEASDDKVLLLTYTQACWRSTKTAPYMMYVLCNLCLNCLLANTEQLIYVSPSRLHLANWGQNIVLWVCLAMKLG